MLIDTTQGGNKKHRKKLTKKFGNYGKVTTFIKIIKMSTKTGTKVVKTYEGVTLDQFKLILHVFTQNNIVLCDYTTLTEVDTKEYVKFITEVSNILKSE